MDRINPCLSNTKYLKLLCQLSNKVFNQVSKTDWVQKWLIFCNFCQIYRHGHLKPIHISKSFDYFKGDNKVWLDLNHISWSFIICIKLHYKEFQQTKTIQRTEQYIHLHVDCKDSLITLLHILQFLSSLLSGQS